MKQAMNTESVLFATLHPNISRHVSVFSIMVSFLIALLGIATIIISIRVETYSSTASTALITVGSVLLLIALYRMFCHNSDMVYIPTGSVVSEITYYLDESDLPFLNEILEEKSFGQSVDLNFMFSGSARMDCLISKDCKFVAVQLLHFVPYTYEAVTPIFYYTGEDATDFARHFLMRNN